MTQTTYEERRELESRIKLDITLWGDDDGINDCILRCIADADRLDEVESDTQLPRG